MADPLTSLHDRLAAAPQPVTLSAGFIENSGAVPPPGFQDALVAAFRLGGAPGLELSFDAGDVGPVSGGQFTIAHAQLSFLGYDKTKSDATLRFRQGEASVEVLIETALTGWSWPVAYPAMTGWPYDELSYTTPTFVFTTEPTAWAWRGGATVQLDPGQNFVASLTVPDAFDTVLDLVGVPAPTQPRTLVGPADVSGSDPEVPLPDHLDLRAQLVDTDVSLFFLKARKPAVGLVIETETLTVEKKTVYDQVPSLYFAAKLAVDESVSFDLVTRLMQGGSSFGFALIVDQDAVLSPADAVALLSGAKPHGSFLDGVPAPLQQFLTRFGLQRLGVAGTLPPNASLSSVGITLATSAKLPLFTDPVSGQEFAIDSFGVAWTLVDPLGDVEQLIQVTASFKLWQSVFQGEFEVSIDQDLRIDGRFDGSVSFRNVLSAVTANHLELPSGVDASLSDFALQLDPVARSYSLAATLDAEFSFLTWANRPLVQIKAMRLSLGASVPEGSGKTAYTGGFAGWIGVGPVVADVSAQYDGTARPSTWQLKAALAEPIDIVNVVEQFFEPGYTFPDFLNPHASITAFTFDATIPSTGQSKYEVLGALSWTVPLAALPMTAEAGLKFDPSRGTGKELSGSVTGTLGLPDLGTSVQVGYQFGDGRVLWVAWEGVRGQYDLDKNTLALSLAGWSAGSVIQKLVRTVGDPYFELEPPWDFLNQIPLDGLRLVIDFSKGATQRFYAEYTLSKPIELGFLTIKGLYFKRGEGGTVELAIDGSTTISSLQGPLFDPKQGQDVKKLPSPPGQGNAYFELLLLVLGQRVGIRGAPAFDSTKAVIGALEKAPPTTGDQNPVDPTGSGQLEPYYDPTREWLFAAHFGLLKVGSIYTFECMVVFNDPDLYGLRLAFNGEKAKVLDGLVLDVLYKKVTDDVGVYKVEFTFPKSLRQIDFGAFSITLPTIGVEIYTNGDFLFDFGFPYNLDFSRSFTLQAIIYGVPVLGSAGFYFGRLSVGAADQLPQSTPGREVVGTFGTAIVFGIGIQLGVGRTFEKGPLSAGFSITAFGIVEGIIAPWHPPTDGALVPASQGGALQGDYFFRLKGTFGVIGKLYGSVDFAIVKADVNLTVTLSVSIAYEAYADIQLSASASVSVSVSIRINLGLFSIRISFSFSATVTADLTIQTPDHDAPWYSGKRLATARPAAVAALPRAGAPPRPRQVVRTTQTATTLHLHPAPQFTVLSPDGVTLGGQEGAFVFLIATDAPTADGSGNREGSSFGALCEALFPWVIDALAGNDGDEVDLATVAGSSVSKTQLQQYVSTLSAAPLAESDIETKFLAPSFTVVLEPAATDRETALKDGATIFPAFSGLTLTVPSRSGSGNVDIALRDYVKVTPKYRSELVTLFAELAARVEDEAAGQGDRLAATDDGDPEPLAQFVFEDWFGIVAQQLLQAGADAIGDYAYTLKAGDSISSIVDWATTAGNAVGPLDVATPNLTHDLQPGRQLNVPGLTYTVQHDDTLQRIADRYTDAATKRWAVTPSQLILTNQNLKGLVAAGIDIGSHHTGAGESFASVADALGVPIATLAADASLYPRADLLAPGCVLDLPAIAYTTAADGSDTLSGIVQRFDVPLAAVAEDAANQLVGDLFAAGTIWIANLESLLVGDVWKAIAATDEVAQVAGMVARFQLHGLRLPKADGLELPDDFLYGTDQQGWGLHQLTGQQFPTPPLSATPTYEITLAKDSTLDWLQLPTPQLDLGEQARELFYLLGYAQAHAFDPGPTLGPEPAVTTRAKRYAAQSETPWSTADQARLEQVTAPPALRSAAPPSTDAPQATPILWDLPTSLTRRVADRAAALGRLMTPAVALGYLPAVAPEVATSDPASGVTTFSAVDRYATATRVQFEVKRLAQADDRAPQRPGANDAIPPGTANEGAPSPLAPFTYELVGPSPADAQRLERLLVAMDSLGEDLVSQLFLLYPTAGPGSPGLQSRSDAEFLSFITQTNLSTETNPPAVTELALGAGAPPRGIANSKGEFVKLLWELATVRSGGYYLYYQLLKEGAGLPDTLFDAGGTATLTLVVAYDRAKTDAGDGAHLLETANAIVTTDPIDVARSVLSLRSASAQATSAKLGGSESLDDLAALYGTDVGRLAALNGPVAFSVGAEIPIAGAIHQVTAADVNSGDPLSTIATYWSAGAKTRISADQLAKFNLNVPPVLGAALRIPPITYVRTSTPGPPGTGFASLGAYYGLSADALGDAARGVHSLFPPQTTLTVDSQERDLQPGIGVGNAGVELTRPAPPDPCQPEPAPCLAVNPTQTQIDAFASAYMQSLYTILSAGIRATPFFGASPQGLPFGPRKSHSPEEAQLLRRPEDRQALVALTAAEPLEYVQALGFGSFAAVNPAPAGDPDGPIPPRSANPYTGVGTPIQLHLEWLDVFGNHTVSAFSAPPSTYAGPLNDVPVAVTYSDRIVGLSQWPNVQPDYRYAGPAGSPELVLSLVLRTDAYDPATEGWQQAAENDLKTWTRIYFQLNQDYTSVDVPGLSGQAVSMSLTNTLFAVPKLELDANDASAVRQFVAACLTYVWHRSRGEPGGAAPSVEVSMPIATGDVAGDDVIPLSVSFTLRRRPELCDPALRAVPGGTSDTTEVLPRTSGTGDLNVSLDAFAVAAETAFVTADWQLRICASASGDAVWAVRMAKTPGQGLGYTIEDGASFYAPAPLATTLRSGPAEIKRYETGKPFPASTESLTFAGVDLNAWAQQALAAIDAFLAPTLAGPAFVVDQLLVDDPEKDGNLAKILDHKDTLAAAIARTVKPVLESSADDDATRQAAEDKLYQALLNQMSSGFAVTAVTVFSVKDARYRGTLPADAVAPPRFYGQPQGKPPGASGTAPPNFSLSTGKVPLTAADGDGSSRLAFLFDSKAVATDAYVALELSYAMSHLEHDIVSVPGIDGYEQSEWIKFVTGPFVAPLAPPPADEADPAAVDLPIVLRALPQPPSVTGQTAEATNHDASGQPVVPPGEKPADLALWDYGFSYLYRGAPQDAVSATVEFNRGPMVGLGNGDPTATLFEKLAQFVTVQPAVAADLETYLRPVDGRSTATDDNVQKSGFALAALEQLVGEVATAYDAWSRPSTAAVRPQAAAGGPAPVVYRFDIGLANHDGRARVEIHSGDSATPAPIVDIEPDVYEARQVEDHEPGVVAAYEYLLKGSDPEQRLAYEDALAIPARTVRYTDLDLFGRQDGYASIQVLRNVYVVPKQPTTETFRFSTPEVRFADRIVPLLAYSEFPLDPLEVPPAALEAYLSAFFDSLLSGAAGQEVAVKMTSGYAFRLVPQQLNIPPTVLPIHLLPPTPVTPGNGPPAFVTAVSGAVVDWLRDNPRPGTEDAQLTFGLEVFATAHEQKPLLTIRDLHLDVDHLPTS